MAVYVITEEGQQIELTGDLMNGGPAADAYVADQIAVCSPTPASEPDPTIAIAPAEPEE